MVLCPLQTMNADATSPKPDETTTALINGRVMSELGLVNGLSVVVQGDRIGAIVADDDMRLGGLDQHDLRGRILLPGFIDCQCNGGGGALFNDEPTVDALRRIAAAHRRFGTTGFLPTLITDEPEVMRAAVNAVAQAIAEDVPGILGIHLEGPFLNASRKGIHDAAKFRAIDDEDMLLFQRGDAGIVMITLAPECVSQQAIIDLAQAGVIVSAGHTASDYAATREALRAGVRGFTHLFNAMTPMTSREPGAVGAALDDPESWCSVIVDGHHVHPATLRIAIAAKPAGKIMLVTDAMSPVGSAQTQFMLLGRPITVVDGVCRDAAGTLAGSTLDMASAVRNTVRLLGLSLVEASRMASAYPAAFLGLADSRGTLASGQRADFAVVDDALQVHETWIGGERFEVDPPTLSQA